MTVNDHRGHGCDPDRCAMSRHPNRKSYLREVRAGIIRHGWMVQGVFGVGAGRARAYTVGLTEAGLPELMISHITDQQLAARILNNLARQSLAGELPPWRVRVEGVPGDFAVKPADPATAAQAKIARALYGPARVRVAEVNWYAPGQ